jgi:hypothetical protein
VARGAVTLKKGDPVMISGGQTEIYAVVLLVGEDGAVTATQSGGTALIADAGQVRRATPTEVASAAAVK